MTLTAISARNWQGYFFGVIYCLLTAASTSLIHINSKINDPMILLFLATIFSIIYFHLINIKKLTDTYKACFRYYKHWIILSCFVTINWIGTFLALKLMDPVSFIIIYFIASASVSLVAECWTCKNPKDFTIFMLSIMLLTVYCLMKSIFDGNNISTAAYGELITIFAAIGGFAYRKSSNLFHQHAGLTVTQLLATRSYLMLIVVLILIRNHSFDKVTVDSVSVCLLVAVLTFIFPLYCMQKSVSLIGAEKYSVLTSLCPAITTVALFVFYSKTMFLNLTVSILAAMLGAAKMLLPKNFI